jgi:hypothetical protein
MLPAAIPTVKIKRAFTIGTSAATGGQATTTMPDPLYLSLWFPSFDVEEMLPHALAVMRQFPISSLQPGVHQIAIHPVSWEEATVLEQRYVPGIPPEQAVLIASDLLHDDYAYAFEAFWDLWMFEKNGQRWVQQPSRVSFFVRSSEFDEGANQQEGQIQIDLGLDAPFLQEEVELNEEAEQRVRTNVAKLVDFTSKIEKNSGARARLLWSESEENFAQKLIARLQKVQ